MTPYLELRIGVDAGVPAAGELPRPPPAAALNCGLEGILRAGHVLVIWQC